ncbi:hypothetical protein EGW08_022723, partial [Elysia chlorotica]
MMMMNMTELLSHIDDMDPSCKSTINDCIHGHILLSRDLIRIVNTPEVQRLRDLKQLGLGSHVYPGATHTRFAHSIGVCHLAGTFVRQLKARQPELPIDDDDIFCVQVAGLCHDLGTISFKNESVMCLNPDLLLQIVSNERTGLDVDKFDYFARDCHALGLSNMFDHNRFMLMARALPCEDGKVHICHKDK